MHANDTQLYDLFLASECLYVTNGVKSLGEALDSTSS